MGAGAVVSPGARHALQEALIWSAAALGGFMLFYFFDEVRTTLGLSGKLPSIAEIVAPRALEPKPSFGGEVHLKSNAVGHFVFEAYINDRPATVMADTGATIVSVMADLHADRVERLILSGPPVFPPQRSSAANQKRGCA